jgi:hypothetical protein
MYGRLPEAIDSLLDWGKVTASSISSRVKNLLGTVDGGDGDVAEEQVLGTHAAILARPAPPSDDGHFEVFFVRRGEERRPVASHDTRWQVDVAEGEVVVRAFGENASRIRLKPNGDVVIEADGSILLGGDTAAKALALAEKTEADFNTFVAHYNAHTHPYVDTPAGAAVTSPIAAGLTGVPQTQGSTKVMSTE